MPPILAETGFHLDSQKESLLMESVLGLLELGGKKMSNDKERNNREKTNPVPLDCFDLKTGRPPSDPQSAACFWHGLATEADGSAMLTEMSANYSDLRELTAKMMLEDVLDGCE